nr:DUF2917 domain-containing protein [Dechloromonas sp.]
MFPIPQALADHPLHLRLQRRETLSVRGSGRLFCEAGQIWLTEAGSREDCVLCMGESWPLRAGVVLTLSSVGGAELSLYADERGVA